MSHTGDMILILDFGSQFTQLIARRVRDAHVYCEIAPYNVDMSRYAGRNIKGYILSGGPSSVSDADAPLLPKSFFDTKIPVLGICYGMQLMADLFGGSLAASDMREYGRAHFEVLGNGGIFSGVPRKSVVWASHGDSIVKIPEGFSLIGSTDTLEVAAMADVANKRYGIQFHPEVAHTVEGKIILNNFLFDICGCEGDWTTESFIDRAVQGVQKQVGEGHVILGISGGVDSTVLAVLLSMALGKRVHAVFVDNGLLRKNEFRDVVSMLGQFDLDLHPVDASELFMNRLKGETDPEKKRKIIGAAFIDIFEEQAKRLGEVQFLAQGTIYPDVIESTSFKGPSHTIKSHHNVGGLKERMHLKLVEPLRELFKDEVRQIGRKLGLAESFINRHPFPGPGLGVRVLGDLTTEKCDLLREADAIYIEELRSAGIYNDIWQAFAVLLPVKSVGVMGDGRTYENTIALRAVTSVDGMTADWARIDPEILAHISNRIIREVRGVNRVVYDISSKPPATIEWE